MDHNEYKETLDIYKQEHLPVVLTAAEAMDLLGVGKNTMYRLLKTGGAAGSSDWALLAFDFWKQSNIFSATVAKY